MSAGDLSNANRDRRILAIVAVALGLLTGLGLIAIGGMALVLDWIGKGLNDMAVGSPDTGSGLMVWSCVGLALGITWLVWAQWCVGSRPFAGVKALACVVLAIASIGWSEFAGGEVALAMRIAGALEAVVAFFGWRSMPKP